MNQKEMNLLADIVEDIDKKLAENKLETNSTMEMYYELGCLFLSQVGKNCEGESVPRLLDKARAHTQQLIDFKPKIILS